MDSFYGGKQGISFIIKDKFATINEMEFCFGQGYYPNKNNSTNPEDWTADSNKKYNKVKYGEYCIIDTDNKNNKDNGKVFRRTGYHGVEQGSLDWPHAEYIGQVIGPAGGIPNVTIDSIKQIQKDLENLDKGSGEIYYWNGTEYTDDWDNRSSIAAKSDTIPTSTIYKSGRDYDTTPAFKYSFYTFQDNGKDLSGNFPVATIGLGFEIPYVDFDFAEVEGVAPTDPVSIEDLNAGNYNSNFYHRYKLKIPEGAPGPFLHSITIVEPDIQNNNYYSLQQCKFVADSSGTVEFTIDTNEGTVNDKINSTKIAEGKFVYYKNGNYVTVKDPDTQEDARFYLWNIQEIKEITINNDRTSPNFGKIKVDYTTTDEQGSFEEELPLLRQLTIKHEYKKDGNNFTNTKCYNLYAHYGSWNYDTNGNVINDGELIGQVAPDRWGVWTTKLSKEENSEKLIPSGPFPDNSNLTNPNWEPDKSLGNLGIYEESNSQSSQKTVYFYYWDLYFKEPENSEDIGQWVGEWKAVGETLVGEISIKIEGFQTDVSAANAPTFKLSAIPISATLATFGARPWR